MLEKKKMGETAVAAQMRQAFLVKLEIVRDALREGELDTVCRLIREVVHLNLTKIIILHSIFFKKSTYP